MLTNLLRVILPLCIIQPALLAGTIDGTIIVKQKLTRKRVTSSTSSYQRGVAVELSADPGTDPLSYERSHVVIYLEGQLPSKPATASMEQKGRRFVPDLLVIPAGSTVSFPNADPIFHNVFSLSKPKSFDLGNYPKDQSRTVTFPIPGIVMVNCHLHSNMSGTIVVSPNQWSVRSDEQGRFSFAGVPAGRYTVVAWHKAAGFFRHEVQVTGSGSVPVEFFIPLEAPTGPDPIAQR